MISDILVPRLPEEPKVPRLPENGSDADVPSVRRIQTARRTPSNCVSLFGGRYFEPQYAAQDPFEQFREEEEEEEETAEPEVTAAVQGQQQSRIQFQQQGAVVSGPPSLLLAMESPPTSVPNSPPQVIASPPSDERSMARREIGLFTHHSAQERLLSQRRRNPYAPPTLNLHWDKNPPDPAECFRNFVFGSDTFQWLEDEFIQKLNEADEFYQSHSYPGTDEWKLKAEWWANRCRLRCLFWERLFEKFPRYFNNWHNKCIVREHNLWRKGTEDSFRGRYYRYSDPRWESMWWFYFKLLDRSHITDLPFDLRLRTY